MGDEITDAYRGAVKTTRRKGLQIAQVSGVGALYTNIRTGHRQAVIQVSVPGGPTSFRRVDPDLFEKRYL